MSGTIQGRAPGAIVAWLAVAGCLGGCEKLAGIETLAEYVPPSEQDGGVDGGGDATGICTLADEEVVDGGVPSAVRFANLVPEGSSVDFCIKPSTQASWQAEPTFIRSFGASCPAGLDYPLVLRPKGLPAGQYDIKAVAAGSSDCQAQAVAELAAVEFPADVTVTVMLAGGNGLAPELFALPERKSSKETNVRFVHAIPAPNKERVYFVATAGPTIPTTAMTTLSPGAGVEFGGVPAATASTPIGPINDAGYVSYMALDFNLGASREGSDKAILAVTVPATVREVTIFAIGVPGSYSTPVRGMLCEEVKLDATGYYTKCTLSELPTLTVDSMNVGLYGLFAPFEAERRQPLIDAVAALGSDVVCLQEISRDSDRQALVQKGIELGTYPYSYNPDVDENTPFTDPTDQQGNTPAPQGPPCAASQQILDLEAAALECVQKNCSTDPNSDGGTLVGGAGCLSSKCLSNWLPMLMSADMDQKRCATCMIVNLLSEETVGSTKDECATNPKAGFSFHGELPMLMLSKHPLSNPEMNLLPSTSYRRGVLHAQMAVPGTDPVDVFCSHFSYIQGTQFPYTGSYGLPTTVEGEELKGWTSEQYFQGQRTLEWIKSRTGAGHLAVLAGDFSSSEEYKVGDVVEVEALNPATIRLFRKDADLKEAIPADYAPVCNFCAAPENAYGSSSKFWLAHIFSWGRPVWVESFERLLTEKTVPLPTDPFQGQVSDNYGVRSKIIYELGW